MYSRPIFIQGSYASTTDETCAVGDSSCSACQDQEDKCSYWASIGECDKNPDYMHQFCQLSCGLCEGMNPPKPKNTKKKTCEDEDDKCEMWAESGECQANPGYMLSHCKLSCHVCVDPE